MVKLKDEDGMAFDETESAHRRYVFGDGYNCGMSDCGVCGPRSEAAAPLSEADIRARLGLMDPDEYEARVRREYYPTLRKRCGAHFEDGRRTGRTTRTIVAALAAVSHGKRVHIQGAYKTATRSIGKIAVEWANRCGLNTNLIAMPGDVCRPDDLVLEDHYHDERRRRAHASGRKYGMSAAGNVYDAARTPCADCRITLWEHPDVRFRPLHNRYLCERCLVPREEKRLAAVKARRCTATIYTHRPPELGTLACGAPGVVETPEGWRCQDHRPQWHGSSVPREIPGLVAATITVPVDPLASAHKAVAESRARACRARVDLAAGPDAPVLGLARSAPEPEPSDPSVAAAHAWLVEAAADLRAGRRPDLAALLTEYAPGIQRAQEMGRFRRTLKRAGLVAAAAAALAAGVWLGPPAARYAEEAWRALPPILAADEEELRLAPPEPLCADCYGRGVDGLGTDEEF